MADEPEEVQEITTICQGLNINIGTLHKSSIESMFLAGKKANELGHPVLLDPVGAGASTLRTQTAVKLMQEVRFSVIRGNMSEIKVLSGGMGGARGVDACRDGYCYGRDFRGGSGICKSVCKILWMHRGSNRCDRSGGR